MNGNTTNPDTPPFVANGPGPSHRSAGAPALLQRVSLAVSAGVLVALLALLLPLAGMAAEKKGQDGCVNCHSQKKFFVQNKKLYDYFQGWKLSIHAQEKVACSQCHGGNSKASNKDAAHGKQAMGAGSKSSPINYQNIPATCAKCHKKVYKNFQESAHFDELKNGKSGQQAPTCVTCHGSVNTAVLSVKTVRETCRTCHNKKEKNHPEIPAEAESVLNNFLSIHRYYRYIATQGKPEAVKAFFQLVDPEIENLAAAWHTFDLEKVYRETQKLIKIMQVMRNDVRRAKGGKG